MTDQEQAAKKPSRRHFLRFGAAGLFSAAGAVAGVATVLGFGEKLWYRFDQLAQFRPQYFAGLVVVAVATALLRSRKTAAVFLLLAFVNVAVILPSVLSATAEAPDGAPRFKVVLANVYTTNRRHDRFIDFLRAEKPDFAVIEEVNTGWLTSLSRLSEIYPHVKAAPREDNFGIALLSRHPMADAQILHLGSDVPSVIASCEIDGNQLTIVGTHPLPPANTVYWRTRNRQISEIAGLLQDRQGHVVLLGDLNTTPWTSPFRRLRRSTGLHDSVAGRFPFGTWPTHFPPLRIPIDHCLYSDGLAVADRRRGPDIGSDHFPLVVELAFSPSGRD